MSWKLWLLGAVLASQKCVAFVPSRPLVSNPLSDNRQQKLMRRDMMMDTVGHFFETSPYEASFLTCAAKASLADLVAQFRQLRQKTEEAKELANEDDAQTIELQRTMSFLLYGGLYQGCSQYYIYNNLFPAWFGVGNDPLIVVTKVLFDMSILAPFMPLPISYSIKSLLYGNPITDGLKKYMDDVVHQDLLFKYWLFWGPVQSVNFMFVPDHYRILFMASFSFLWMVILSTISNQQANEGCQELTDGQKKSLC